MASELKPLAARATSLKGEGAMEVVMKVCCLPLGAGKLPTVKKFSNSPPPPPNTHTRGSPLIRGNQSHGQLLS